MQGFKGLFGFRALCGCTTLLAASPSTSFLPEPCRLEEDQVVPWDPELLFQVAPSYQDQVDEVVVVLVLQVAPSYQDQVDEAVLQVYFATAASETPTSQLDQVAVDLEGV